MDAASATPAVVPDWDEYTLSAKPALELLQLLGYTIISPETLVSERESLRSPLLLLRLRSALRRLNPWLSDDNLERAVREVAQPKGSGLLDINEALHITLTRGISVQQDRGDGLLGYTVRYIDFANPEHNDLVVTREFSVQGLQRTVRFDVAVFVNGLPLAYIECKSPTIYKPLDKAVKQLLDYQEVSDDMRGMGAPQAFYTAQLLCGVCREAAVFGSVLGHALSYAPFPEAYPKGEAYLDGLLARPVTVQDRLLYSVLEPSNLLAYSRDYVGFDVDNGRKVKKLARHQQRMAVDLSVRRILGEDISDRYVSGMGPELHRGGVIWHTQGSGKSLTMVWLAQKLRQSELGLENPTILIVTDRTDLDNQISDTFKRLDFPSPIQATRARHLEKLLMVPRGQTIMTTLQKFEEAYKGKPLSESNLFVLVDEAHRSQYGALAAKMRGALPNAIFIAFTGTPIDKKNRHTLFTFGPYIHTYTMEESVRDGATVPIFYEGRLPKEFVIGAGSLDVLVEKALETYLPEQREALKRKYATQEIIASSSQRIREVAADIVGHFNSAIAPNGFKAQIVAATREAAAHYKKHLDALGAPPSEVIYTAAQGDSELLSRNHTTKAEQDEIIARFKNPNHPLAFLIVVDMLLTGFDAPIEQVMYLDKGLREHGLLQAIARVNRVYPGKSHGLIVDYWGVSSHLQEALELFEPQELGVPMRPLSSELPRLEARHRRVLLPFAGIERDNLDALLKVLEPEDVRQSFEEDFRAFSQSLDTLLPSPKALPFIPDLEWLGKLRANASVRYRDNNLGDAAIAEKIKKLIQDSIGVQSVTALLEPVSIFAPDFEEKLAKLASAESQASEVAHALRHEITLHSQENPVFYASLSKRLEDVLEARRKNRLSAAQQLSKLLPLVHELREAASQKAKNLQLSEVGVAFYDQLEAAGVADVMLTQRIEEVLVSLTVIDWTSKEDVQREMRRRLRRELLATGLAREKVEALITQLLGVARVRLAR